MANGSNEIGSNLKRGNGITTIAPFLWGGSPESPLCLRQKCPIFDANGTDILSDKGKSVKAKSNRESQTEPPSVADKGNRDQQLQKDKSESENSGFPRATN